jgi:hypothetical protein
MDTKRHEVPFIIREYSCSFVDEPSFRGKRATNADQRNAGLYRVGMVRQCNCVGQCPLHHDADTFSGKIMFRIQSRIIPFLTICVALLFSSCAWAATAGAKPLVFKDAVKMPRQSIAPAKEVALNLPALPSRPGMEIVLKFRTVCQTRTIGGCNYTAQVTLNGAPVGPVTNAGDSRLIGRDPSFYLTDRQEAFQLFNGNNLMVMFAPDLKQADAMTTDGQGATYTLNITDLARGVDVNTLGIRNNLTKSPFPGSGDLIVDNIQVGWVDQDQIKQSAGTAPERGAIAQSVSADGIRLSQATAGGFRVDDGNGVAMSVETAVAMDPAVAPSLVAEDGTPKDVKIAFAPLGPAGYRVTADWTGLRLTRTIQIKNALVLWHDRWTNTSSAIRGIPFQYRFFLAQDEGTRFWLAGGGRTTAVAGAAQNPTLFLGSASHPGAGIGISAESDWLRLLMEMRTTGGVGTIFTRTLALPPASSIDFDLTLTPTPKGGYWHFINTIRDRWNLNGRTMARPFFLDYAVAPGISDPQERARKSLGNLGPLTVGAGGWLGLQADAYAVRSGAFGDASLPPTSPEAAAEVDRFLTFRHRKSAQEAFKSEVAAIHAACPDVKVIQLMHPAMEAVYRPLLDRWPIQGDVIRTVEGNPFEDIGYSRSWLQKYADHNWGIYYFVPRPGSTYLRELLHREQLSMDEGGGDGIYCDEFAWAFTGRAYSRYDYSRWDGVSADLDAHGKVLHLKSDNSHVTESSQLQIAGAALSRGKFFLGNGGPTLQSVRALPAHFFIEGGNGISWFPMAQLTATPLVFGNFGDEKTLPGVMAAVRDCLGAGTLYSPAAVNLLLKGPDNFVSKLYPMSVMEIGPGWIRGKERLATIVSGKYECPVAGKTVRLYRYDASGKRIDAAKDTIQTSGSQLEMDVPKDGLAIAEWDAGPATAP